MRILDEQELAACKFQANIFEMSLHENNASSAVFIRRFMNSGVASRIDEGAFMAVGDDELDALREVALEYGPSKRGGTKYSANEMHWIGYLYRYWAIAEGSTSKRVYRIANASTMRKYFSAYHALSPDVAVSRILEAEGIFANEDPIARGVEILRSVRANKATTMPSHS